MNCCTLGIPLTLDLEGALRDYHSAVASRRLLAIPFTVCSWEAEME